MMYTIFCFLLPFWLAVESRLHGSADNLPKIANNALYALPYALYASVLGYAWYFALFVFVGTLCAKPIPHQGFMLNVNNPASLPRSTWITRIVDLFVSNQKSWVWVSLGWAFKGFLIAFSFGIVATWHRDFILAICVVVFGTLSSALAYWIGWTKLRNKYGIASTEWGEILTGFFAGLGFLVGAILEKISG